MKVYHGSYMEIANPDIIHSRKKVDFGVGFYVTPIEEQAKNWCRQYILRHKPGIVSIYNFDESVYDKCTSIRYESYISKKEANGRLAFAKPNFQICLRTQNVIDEYLVFEGSYSV